MDKAEGLRQISLLFDQHCHLVPPYAERHFKAAQKAEFLAALYDKIMELWHPIDFSSPPAVTAMMRAQRHHRSVQGQLEHFPAYFQEEVEKARVKK